jgi:outer membrane protein assembly factor BamB
MRSVSTGSSVIDGVRVLGHFKAPGSLSSVMRSAAMIASLVAPAGALADDWTNMGGNQGRNGNTAEWGPDSLTQIWSGAPSSIIGWHPFIEGRRVFVVRQTGFPPEPNSDESPIYAMDLDTGQILWRRDLPYLTNDWTTFILGASDGRVYASRSGNGASVKAVIHALDAATGATIWTSAEKTDIGPYDGVIFADNGDLIVASFQRIWRIRAVDGLTAWSVPRVGSVSGTTGGAVRGDDLYIADAVVGGHAIKKFDLTTGAFLYQSPTMPGFTIQNTPMVAPDGTIYLSRTQNNAAVDFFYAIDDNGTQMTIRWSVPAEWSTNSEFAVALDGDVYMFGPGKKLQKRRAADGTLAAEFPTAIPADFLAPRMAVDCVGNLFMSNGAFNSGRLYAFTPDLVQLWNTPAPNINIGGPAMGSDGTLVIAGITNAVRAFRVAHCPSDFDKSGFVDTEDFDAFVRAFEAGDVSADFDESGFVDTDDFDAFVQAFEEGC